MRWRPADILWPNEHGAWGMLGVAFLTGWLGAAEFSWRPLLLAPAVLFGFLARYPLGLYFKKRKLLQTLGKTPARELKWTRIYGAMTAVSAAPLFYPLGWWCLISWGGVAALAFVIHLCAIHRREDRTLTMELAAMVGISVVAPATASVATMRSATGCITSWSIVLWIMVIVFFTWRVMAVRTWVRRPDSNRAAIRSVGKRELIYSLFFLLIVLGAAFWIRSANVNRTAHSLNEAWISLQES